MNHSNWFVNRFTGLIKPLNRIDSKEWIIQIDSWTDSLVWSSRWTELTQKNESFKLIREPIHWFDQVFEQNWIKIMNHSKWFVNRFTGLIKSLNRFDSKEWIIQTDSWTDSLVWSSLWTELNQKNESFKLIREPIHWFDQVFEQNWLKRMNHSNWFVNRFTGLIKSLNRIESKELIIQTDSWTDSLVWSSLWTELTKNNESFKLIREPIHWFDQVFEQNWIKRMNHSNWFVNRFTGLIKSLNRIDLKEWIIQTDLWTDSLVWSSLWTELNQKN